MFPKVIWAKNAGLIAGGSLLVDYILTVAVSVSAGTDAITSAFPALHDYTVIIAIVLVICITILNLRGLTESASVLAYPVYLFVLALIVLIAVGLFKIATGHAPASGHAPIGTAVSGVTLFLLLRAFASGCSALTGVEAISNAIPNFKDPAPKKCSYDTRNDGRNFSRAVFPALRYLRIGTPLPPKLEETVVSQIASEIFGRNFMYYFIQGATALILVLAANTGFFSVSFACIQFSGR
ncbi:hypothetical protein GCM10020331_042680 [Ectobacillus funiculus]